MAATSILTSPFDDKDTFSDPKRVLQINGVGQDVVEVTYNALRDWHDHPYRNELHLIHFSSIDLFTVMRLLQSINITSLVALKLKTIKVDVKMIEPLTNFIMAQENLTTLMFENIIFADVFGNITYQSVVSKLMSKKSLVNVSFKSRYGTKMHFTEAFSQLLHSPSNREKCNHLRFLQLSIGDYRDIGNITEYVTHNPNLRGVIFCIVADVHYDFREGMQKLVSVLQSPLQNVRYFGVTNDIDIVAVSEKVSNLVDLMRMSIFDTLKNAIQQLSYELETFAFRDEHQQIITTRYLLDFLYALFAIDLKVRVVEIETKRIYVPKLTANKIKKEFYRRPRTFFDVHAIWNHEGNLTIDEEYDAYRKSFLGQSSSSSSSSSLE